MPSMACPDVCDFAGSQNNNRQQETHATVTCLSGQNVNSDRINMGISNQKIRSRRGRSPKRRGAREISLAVSSFPHINSGDVFLF